MLPSIARSIHLSAPNTFLVGVLAVSSCWVPALTTQAQNDGASSAGSAVTDSARRGALRRQEDLRQIAKTMVLGDRRHADRDYAGALKLYREAFTTCPNFAAATETRDVAYQKYQETVQLYADELAREGRQEAAVKVVNTFFADARDAGIRASEVSKKTRWLLEDLQDFETYEPGRTPKHIENVADVNRLFVLADGYIQLGDLDKATESYVAILEIDPYNRAASRGLQQVNEMANNYYSAAFNETRATMLQQIAALWESPVRRFGVDLNVASSGLGAKYPADEASVRAKLNGLILPSISFEQTPLREVLDFLSQRSKEIDVTEDDPKKKGVNIVLSSDNPTIGSKPVTLQLNQIPLGAALDYVTELASVEYRIDGFALVVTPPGGGTDDAMITKRYRVPPTFISGGAMDGGNAGGDPFANADPFAETGPLGGANSTLQPRLTPTEFMTRNGIPFPDDAFARFIPETSTLIVRNTQANLDLIEVMIESSFGNVAKLLKIQVKQMEISDADLKEIGFDWLLGQFNVSGSEKVFGSGGTYGITGTEPAARGRDYPFTPPGSPFPLGRYPVSASNQRGGGDLVGTLPGLTTATRSPGTFAVGGAFTDPQFQMVIRAIAQKKGTDLVSTGTVVTQAGQRAQVRVVREFIYPTEYDPPEIPESVGVAPGGLGLASGSNFGPITPAHPTAFDMREVGSLLEVEGSISGDGHTISLSLTPEVVRFDGFVDYGSAITQFDTDFLTGRPFVAQEVPNRILQPIFLVARETTSVDVYDGETLVIGGLIGDRHDKISDGIPGLQDIPFFGRMFKTEIESQSRINLLFFVTVDIVDPAGGLVRKVSEAEAGPGDNMATPE